MPRIEIDRRTAVRALVFGVGLPLAVGSCDAASGAPQRIRTETRTPVVVKEELLVPHHFERIQPDRKSVIVAWGETSVSTLYAQTGNPHFVEAQGIINPNIDERNQMLGARGALQIGVNEVQDARSNRQLRDIRQIYGGVYVYVPTQEAQVFVRTEGDTPLSYTLSHNGENGMLLAVHGGDDVIARAKWFGKRSVDATPFPEADDPAGQAIPIVALL